MAPPQKGGLEIEMTHSVKYEYLKYGNWDRNLGSSGNLDFCTFHNLTSFSPARAFQYQLQVFPTLLLQNFKLFTRLALKLPFPKSDMLSPGDVEGDSSHSDVLEHRDRLAMGHAL